MKYLKSFENIKYKILDDEEFYHLFNTNCKNFSSTKDQLFRGDKLKADILYHDNTISRKPSFDMVTFDVFFNSLTNLKKFPVVRDKSTMGLAGGDIEEMIYITSNFKHVDNTVYKVIPYDNSEIVFCPIFDLILLDYLNIKITPEDFIKVKYTKRFKVPVEKLKEIQNRLITKKNLEKIKKLKLVGNKSIIEKGFEFFISSPCLLVNIDSFANKIIKLK